jgi:hypothetical protein
VPYQWQISREYAALRQAVNTRNYSKQCEIMKKQNLSFILTVGMCIILACAVFLVFQNKALGKALLFASQEVVQCEERKQLAEAKNIVLESNVILSAQSNGKQIDNNILLTNIKNKTYTSAEIFGEKTPCLVFRYSNVGGCSPCINTTFMHLERLKNSVNHNKLRIVIIPSDMELRQVIVEKSQPTKNKFTFYLVNENGLGLPVDEALVSYLFIAEGNKTSNFFVVDRMFLPLLEKYVNVLIENYK